MASVKVDETLDFIGPSTFSNDEPEFAAKKIQKKFIYLRTNSFEQKRPIREVADSILSRLVA